MLRWIALSLDTIEAVLRPTDHRQVLDRLPKRIMLTREQLDAVVGGVLSAEDVVYCQQAVEYYHGRGYTLEQLQQEMGAYQSSLRKKGNNELADRSAEYLEYMVSIW